MRRLLAGLLILILSSSASADMKAEVVKVRGRNFVYFNNAIQSWRVAADGSVHHVQA